MAPNGVARKLRDRFVKKKKEVGASERTTFSIRRKTHNMSITTNHVFLWKTKDALRELVTNCIDGCVEMANEIGHGGEVMWTVHASEVGAATYISTSPGMSSVLMTTEWRATAMLCGVVVGEIHFVRNSADTDFLYAFIANHFTCLHVLKIFGFGFSTKIGDSTQSGKFGDGLKSAAVTLVRPWYERRSGDRTTKARMTLQTNGRRWTFSFDTSEEPSWLCATKESKNVKGNSFTAKEKRDTVIALRWADSSVGLTDIFDEKMYMVFSPGAATLQLGQGAGLINGPEFKNTIYVAGVRVCTSESFVRGVGYTDDKMLGKNMTRDRSVIGTDHIWDSFVTRVKSFLEKGGTVDRIYQLTAAVKDGDRSCAFHHLASDRSGGTWPNSFAAHFSKLYGGDSFPYNETAHRDLIKDDLGKTPVRVGRCLYDILCKSSIFEPVDEAVANEFVNGGKDRDWPEDSIVYRCAEIVTHEVLKRAGEDITHQLKLRDTPCKRYVVAQQPQLANCTNVYIKSSIVDQTEASGNPLHMRITLHEIMHEIMRELQDLVKTDLDHGDVIYLHTRIGDISRGLFDEKYELEGEERFDEGGKGGKVEDNSDSEDFEDSDVSEEFEDAVYTSDSDEESSSSDSDEESISSDSGSVHVEEAPSPRKRSAPDDDEDEEYLRPRKRGRIEPPKPTSVTREMISASKEVAPPPPPNNDVEDHVHSGDLMVLGAGHFTGEEYGAVYYKSSSWKHNPTQRPYDSVASVVRLLLRHVFDWNDSVTFGVYMENSKTEAFTLGGTNLFVNAFYANKHGSWPKNIWYYYSILCHEMTHMSGCRGHDANFANTMTDIVTDYHLKLISYMMTVHVCKDCDANCFAAGKHTCSEHRGVHVLDANEGV